ncbi:MAG: VIT1/CCC1 transporter family protein [Bacteroidales bacterium]|nr:VIT1/CCC1 transporter family protein [Bacteroidales bacterium]
MTITKDQHKLLLRFQKQEITGSIVYGKLAGRQKNPHNSKILNQIAQDENRHYEIYKKITGKDVSPNRFQIMKYTLISILLGPTFSFKLMERNEADDQKLYEQLSHIPEIPLIIVDEEKHEHQLINMLNENKLNYMGSVVLGLNDALVELTGALAGLTFALQNPPLIALTGSITGIAAAFSMAASEYLSTKSEKNDKHAVTASIYTGIAYLFTVIVLILPFLLLKNVFLSLGLTLLSAIGIIAAFNYYYSVVKDERFTRRFSEMVLLSMGVALLSFIVGLILRKYFHIDV